MRIYLVGFMGAGKTTVGRALARRLQWEFCDLDREVARSARMPVARIIAERGEESLRGLEHQILYRLSSRPRTVIATGGGAFCRQENVDLLRRTGTTVWLDPPAEVLFRRVERSPKERPLFHDRERARRLLEERRDWYRQADLRIRSVGEEEPEVVAGRIIEAIKETPCAI